MFLSAVIADGSIASFLGFGKIDYLFKANEVDAFNFVAAFVKEYNTFPAPETLEAHTGTKLVPHVEPAAYYHDLMELRHIEFKLKQTMSAVSKLFEPDNKDEVAALETMTEAVMELAAAKSKKIVVDFREAYETIMAEYSAKWSAPDETGLHLGWPKLDGMSGGLVRGDVLSFVGRPAAGKTWQMLRGAHYGWAKAGKNHNPETDQSRLFVSMEIGQLQIMQRLTSMQTHTEADKLKKAAFGTEKLNVLKSGLLEIEDYGAPFWIVDGNLAATVEDIYMLVRQLRPAAVFIDGAYLIKHPTEKDRFRRVAENVELIKQSIAPLAPTACSWQFAKSASKKNTKKGEKVTVDDIGYTDAIAQISSIVLGLFEEESVSTLKQRKVEILKGRNGETGSFTTHWDFKNMNFDEVIEQDVSDLQFL